MPPAVFPPVLGFLGLGLLWRLAPGPFGPLRPLAETLLGMAAALLVLAIGLYGLKAAARPGVLREEIATLPGRTGLAAGAMAVMLSGAVAAPYLPAAVPVLLALGLGLHGVLALACLWRLVAGPAAARSVSPADHLVFVGGIAGSAASHLAGLEALTALLLWTALAFSGAIYLLSLRQIMRARVPAPLRPLLAIHLSPVSLAGGAAFALGHAGLGLALALAALLLAGLLLARLPWLCAAGFSPFWGSFTFPVVAFAEVMLQAGEAGSALMMAAGLGALVFASVTVPVIVVRVLRLWLRGSLAVSTNAAAA